MKRYFFGTMAAIVAISAVAFKSPKRFANQYKIKAIVVVGSQTRLVTDDASADPSISCLAGSNVCKVTTNLTPSYDGTNYYFVRGTGVSETSGQFQ